MIFALFLFFSAQAHALDVVCTLPWLGDVTKRLAPDASITVLARGTEDPHYLSPTPALMAKVSKADLYVVNGMNLELWSDRLVDGAGNPRIRPGQPGQVVATQGVPRLEVPSELSRSQGDMHPDGNPHIWMDPLNVIIAANNITAGLSRVDAANKGSYEKRNKAFEQEIYTHLFGADLVGFMGGETLARLARSGKLMDFLKTKGLDGRLGGWLGAAQRGRTVVFYHASWAYLIDRFGLDVVGYVEDRPGISPSASHKAQLATAMKAKGCRHIGVTSYYDDRIAQALAGDTGATVTSLPGDVGGTPAATDYFAMMDTIVATFLK